MQQLAYLLKSKVRPSRSKEVGDLRARRRLFGLCLYLLANTESGKTSTICRPLVPEDTTMVRADKSAALSSSAVDTSSLAADAGTATPMLERAKSVRVVPISLPSLDSRSMFARH